MTYNLNIILPEIFLSLSILIILMLGVFIKKSFNLIFNLTSLILILTVAIILNNPNNELLSGSLLEISINYNERNSLSILDTSLIMEGDNVYVYKVDKENTVKKVPVEIGLRKKGIVEITSGLEDGDTVVAEGLKKTRPNGKIKPIKYGSKQNSSGWGKKKKSTQEENKK